jgi:hypothetical protein
MFIIALFTWRQQESRLMIYIVPKRKAEYREGFEFRTLKYEST